MKVFYRISVILLLMIFYSCDKDEISNDNDAENNIKYKTKKVYNHQVTNETKLELQHQMQWVSYLAAQSILRSQSVEKEFIDIVDNSRTKRIALKVLLTSSNAFREAMVSEFNYYNSIDICRVPTPSGAPKPNHEPGMTPEGYKYIQTLLDSNYEFYLPNGYTESVNSIKSSAYIYRTASLNLQGYDHFKRCDVDNIIINSNSRGNILVLRTSE